MSEKAKRHKWIRGMVSTCSVCGLKSRMRMGWSGHPVYGDKEFSTDGGGTWQRRSFTPPCEGER